MGVSRRQNCNGSWVSNRDSVHARIVNELLGDSGADSYRIPTAGTCPALASGAACAESRCGGTPDVRGRLQAGPEQREGQQPLAANGYLNFENYLTGRKVAIVCASAWMLGSRAWTIC